MERRRLSRGLSVDRLKLELQLHVAHLRSPTKTHVSEAVEVSMLQAYMDY